MPTSISNEAVSMEGDVEVLVRVTVELVAVEEGGDEARMEEAVELASSGSAVAVREGRGEEDGTVERVPAFGALMFVVATVAVEVVLVELVDEADNELRAAVSEVAGCRGEEVNEELLVVVVVVEEEVVEWRVVGMMEK